VLRRLAPHPGGCTLAAAEAVCAGDGVPVAHVAELLGRLVDRSLVVRVDGTSGSRYRVLETIRDFARTKLAAAGEEDVVRRRYERYFAGLAQRAEPRLYGHSELFAYLGGLYHGVRPDRMRGPDHRYETVVSRDGTPIAVEVYGSGDGGGPAVVLVGGALNDRRTFVSLTRHLASRFTAVTYDRGGATAARPSPTPWSGSSRPWPRSSSGPVARHTRSVCPPRCWPPRRPRRACRSTASY
jgi:hypothetical protein